jgi:flavin reductase (DIM6/NTAB) family NADH-FMN oxidoreductase RutF
MARESAVPGSCYFYYPRLVCILGVKDEAKGRTNFAPVTWTTPLSSDPPLFGVCLSPTTHSHQLVLKTGEFTVNFLGEEHASLAEGLGRLSGRETDKVEALHLAIEPGEALSTPVLAAAYASAECLLLERHHVGDQTLLVGEVHRVRTAADAFDADGVLRLERLHPLLYLGSNRYTTTAVGPLSGS